MEGPFRDPDIPDGERTAYRFLVDGEHVGGGVLAVERVSEGSRQLYRQSLAMNVGRDVDYRLELTFRRRAGTIHAEAYRLETRDGGGAPIAAEEGRFRQVRALHWGAERQPYPRDLAPVLGCPVALRGLEFERGLRRGFSVWFANTAYWEVEARVEALERLELPVGRMDAWRVVARPSLEHVDRTLDKLVTGLLPPLVLHFEEEPPHRFLRFEFPTGPYRSNPPGLIEATELDGPPDTARPAGSAARPRPRAASRSRR